MSNQSQNNTDAVDYYEQQINSLNVGDCFVVKGDICTGYNHKIERITLTGTNLLWVISKRSKRYPWPILSVVCLTSEASHPDNTHYGINWERVGFPHDFSFNPFDYDYDSSHKIISIIPCSASMKNSRVKRAVSKGSV